MSLKGPVTYNDGKKETLAGVIIGISEIKSGRCGDSNEYSLAVSVHSHKDWIQKQWQNSYLDEICLSRTLLKRDFNCIYIRNTFNRNINW